MPPEVRAPTAGEAAAAIAPVPFAPVAGPPAGEGAAEAAAEAAPDPALDVLLARLAGELEGLARIAAALDADIGALAARPDPGALRRRMQDLDLLRQMASDLAVVQRHVAELMPTGLALPLGDTLGRLQLGAVAARLRSGPAPAAGGAAVATVGAAVGADDNGVDLF